MKYGVVVEVSRIARTPIGNGLFDDGKILEVQYHAFDTEWSEDLDPTSIVNEIWCCDEVKKYCNHAYRK